MELTIDRLPSPIGAILLACDGEALAALEFEDHEERFRKDLRRHHRGRTIRPGACPGAVARAIRAYFDGDRSALDGLTVKANGTPFQERVWAALRRIRFGETVSYGGLAHSLGMPRAYRAVGLANGSNPIAIVVPCHRVIGANDRLIGFGGGLARKQWLLGHERFELPLGLPVDRRASG